MNNYEKIKQMNIDEMSEFFSFNSDFRFNQKIGDKFELIERIKGNSITNNKIHEIQFQGMRNWLESEVENDNN